MNKKSKAPSAGGQVRPPTAAGGAVKNPFKKAINKSCRKFFNPKRNGNPNLYHGKIFFLQVVIVNSPGNFITRNINNSSFASS